MKIRRIYTQGEPLGQDDEWSVGGSVTPTVTGLQGGVVIDQGHMQSPYTTYTRGETLFLIESLAAALLEQEN